MSSDLAALTSCGGQAVHHTMFPWKHLFKENQFFKKIMLHSMIFKKMYNVMI